ncbi:MAG: LysR family transcriptional regulator [Alphaproteobacteria bacterium]|nr:LysR family transcriptional regulator [Alphaproteobacteria bacterium]
MKNLNYLRTFLEIVKYHSLAEFAKETKTVHAYAAHVIKEMEKEFACQLVQRKQRRIQLQLTRQGALIVKSAPAVLEALEDLKKKVRHDALPDDIVEFSLYSSRGLCDALVCPNLAKIYNAVPQIKLNIFPRNAFMSHDEKIGVLTLGAYVDETQKDCIKQVHLRDFSQSLWASEAYIALYGKPTTITDLRYHHFITHASNSALCKTLKKYNLFGSNNVTFIESTTGLLQAAVGGTGIISTSPEILKIYQQAVSMERVLPELDFKLSVYFSYPVDWHNTLLMNSLITCFQSIFNAA